ncbi:hypothetical protein BU24DRAFT_416984 [Aaosphaeria arxii CBS 175.79]|uniref:Transmembrane protein n=1 Tax=Aaosphaeria arxii CBS 175.79 TaxID=1450172 RepID=A0A6A5Y998_9PLEO|nr:uncharacterized protein BU24DRAFT_416984 [Aaosphaeria arxii CBS 175.79]KAF2021321.1 hypothetical protein BU24DRAFT_416984 [Aaosphaeria arxii CBS 175.79]
MEWRGDGTCKIYRIGTKIRGNESMRDDDGVVDVVMRWMDILVLVFPAAASFSFVLFVLFFVLSWDVNVLLICWEVSGTAGR